MKDATMIAPDHLREIIPTGLLSFPVTAFDAEERLNAKPFAAHLEWLFSCPGAGTARHVSGDAPVIAGCGYGTRIACDMARGQALQIGPVIVQPGDLVFGDADGVVVLPPDRARALRRAAAARVQAEARPRDAIVKGGMTLDLPGLRGLTGDGRFG